MKKILSSIGIAFSMYSKIPMPVVDWKKENMRYVMCAFPFVGLVLGAILYGWLYVCGLFAVQGGIRSAICVLLPIWLSGGIHVDGFMDTWDGLGSYQEKEKALEILKDSHVGAMAVLHVSMLLVLEYGIWSSLSMQEMMPLCMGFFLSRVCSGFSVAAFPCAKGSGLVATFSTNADRVMTKVVLGIEGAAVLALLLYFWPLYGACMAISCLVTMGIYYGVSMKRFGGITGDLAGWFLVNCECVMALSVAACSIFS